MMKSQNPFRYLSLSTLNSIPDKRLISEMSNFNTPPKICMDWLAGMAGTAAYYNKTVLFCPVQIK